MTCSEVRELLSALVDEAVSVAERRAIEAHLATCAECRQELAELRETVSLLKRLPPVHAPAGFVDRVVETAYRPSWPKVINASRSFAPPRISRLAASRERERCFKSPISRRSRDTSKGLSRSSSWPT